MSVHLVKAFHGKRDGNEQKHKHCIYEERNMSPEYSFSDEFSEEAVVISGRGKNKKLCEGEK